MEYNGEMYYYVYNIVGDVKGMYDSEGNIVAKYGYSGYGEHGYIRNGAGQSVKDDPTHIANINPFRFKGYYFDAETEFYYLNTRYYDPYVCRFLNADAYISTGQGPLGYNMFAYCGNDPINRYDPEGNAFLTATICGVAVWKIGVLLIGIITTYVIADSIAKNPPAPPSITFPQIEVRPRLEIKPRVEAKPETKDIAPAIPKDPPKSTTIYRYGGTNPGSLTPKAKDLRDGRGLSFSTIPAPGCSMTTIEALNATGIVYAVKDGATHVSVYPVGGTMSDWVSAGSSSIWTQAVKSVIIKWDGVS